MHKKKMRFRQLYPVLSALVIVSTAFLTSGLFNAAQAASPAPDASCNQLNQYGFTTGLVYCILASIGIMVKQYVLAMQTFLRPYEAAALMVAIALYGLKLMSQKVQEPIRETITLVFRVLIGLFCYNQATFIYTTFVGTPGGSGGIINEAIGWVMGVGGSGNNLFGKVIATQCPTPPTPPGYFGGYQVWQIFDCMFMKLMGVANPINNPGAFTTSLLVVVAAALFSGTLGIAATALGISVFLLALKLLVKALFLVLLAYLTIGFLTIFAPLVAPLIFFDSTFLTEKFKRWLGYMISTAIQPVFVLAFLALAISVDDQLIEGNLPGGANGCKPPTFPSGTSTLVAAPAKGFGQDGSGVCSFTQLMYNGNSGNGTAAGNLINLFNGFMEQNSTLFNWIVSGSPQGQSSDGNYYDANAALPTNKAPGNLLTNRMTNNAGTLGVTGMTRLNQYAPLKQMMLTLLTFIFTTWCMLQLMDIIPEMASSMTIGVGVNLYRQLQIPFEGAARSMLSGAEQGAKNNIAGKGLTSGNLQGVPGLLSAGGGAITGALNGLGNYIRRPSG